MDNQQSIHLRSDKNRTQTVTYWFVLLAVCSGVILTIISAMEICSNTCSAGHKYRIFGFSFESVGIAFFSGLTLLQLFTWFYSKLRNVVTALLALAFGAEVFFVYAQKYVIGQWCPICLLIAFVVVIALTTAIIGVLKEINKLNNPKGGILKHALFGSSLIMLMITGFFFAQLGFSRLNPLQASEEALKTGMAFGELQSPIEVYVFTDWKCPACRQVEPAIIESIPEILKQAKLNFVDVVVHEMSLNFLPYNLSFMIHNKSRYLELREALNALSLKTEAPTLEDIQIIANEKGVKFTPMNFSDLSLANNYFQQLTKQLEVVSTPTVAVVSKTTHKGKRLNGKEITHKSILKAIEDVKKE